jgi:hypothetical protein
MQEILNFGVGCILGVRGGSFSILNKLIILMMLIIFLV